MFRLLSALAVAAATISNCGSTSTRFQLTALDFQPANPVPSSEVFMTVEFQNPGTEVVYGTAHRTVSLNGLPVVDETVSLCNEATACPLTTGFNNRSASSIWPDVRGKIVSTVRWSASNGEELLCIKTSVSTAMGPRLRGGFLLNADSLQHLAQPVFVHSKEVALRSEASLLDLCWMYPEYSANKSLGAPARGAMSV
jgi:hypothetical protein